jgi:MoaA/NifB/PqqE/SkfB family radical SAM enzyme
MRINVSIDAGDPETYERIRVGASFSEVCYNIEEFLRIKSELKKDSPNLFVWMVAMHEYIQEIPVLIKTIQKLGLNILILHNISEGDETVGKQLTRDDKKLLEEYKSAAAKKNFILSYHKTPEGNINRTDTRTCVDPWNMVYVNVSGWINPCCLSFGDQQTYFGNIYETSLGKIWNGESFKRFRQELKRGLPNCCKKCPAHSQRLA